MNPAEKPEEFPDSSESGVKKRYTSKHGFEVCWFNKNDPELRGLPANVIRTPETLRNGIYIRLIAPDACIKEDIYIPHGQEADAMKKYDDFVRLVSSWDSIRR